MTPVIWIRELNYTVYPVVYYSSGVGMFLISVFDYKYFSFFPLQRNIFLDQEFNDKKSKSEKTSVDDVKIEEML